MKFKHLRFIGLLILVLTAEYALARAGGGGGSGSGGGILTTILAFILAPFLLIYGAIVSVMLERKRNKAKRLLKQLELEDPLWNHRRMKARIEEIFLKVQKAWMERNQDLAKDCMSDRIYTKHKMQTDEMLANGRKNVLAKINLKEVMIISVADYDDDTKDSFSAHIKGSMIDYDVDDKTGNVLSGDKTKIESFKEIWHFIRKGNKWVLDEIDQDVTMGDIRKSELIKE